MFLYFRITNAAPMNDHLYMMRCLQLAQLAKGHTAPNPMVGAVLVHNGRVIGEGWHKQYGQAHAEVNCIESVHADHRHLIPESTMYVSLEPCSHYGNTPPCAVRLVAEKVQKVIIANIDPFAKVSGRGISILQENSVSVDTGMLEADGWWLNRRFFCTHLLHRPYIILKWAQTLEGYIAPVDGSRFQITNEHSMQLVHRWRTEEGAILIGTKTALSDDPQLTARAWEGKQPLRIVLDKTLKLPHDLKLFDNSTPTWVINEKKEAEEGNTIYKKIPFDHSLLHRISVALHQAGILSLIVEGGATLLNSFIKEGLWDEARIFTGAASLPDGIAAPRIKNAIPAFTTVLEKDILQVYTNSTSKFPYAPGMDL